MPCSRKTVQPSQLDNNVPCVDSVGSPYSVYSDMLIKSWRLEKLVIHTLKNLPYLSFFEVLGLFCRLQKAPPIFPVFYCCSVHYIHVLVTLSTIKKSKIKTINWMHAKMMRTRKANIFNEMPVNSFSNTITIYPHVTFKDVIYYDDKWHASAVHTWMGQDADFKSCYF